MRRDKNIRFDGRVARCGGEPFCGQPPFVQTTTTPASRVSVWQQTKMPKQWQRVGISYIIVIYSRPPGEKTLFTPSQWPLCAPLSSMVYGGGGVVRAGYVIIIWLLPVVCTRIRIQRTVLYIIYMCVCVCVSIWIHCRPPPPLFTADPCERAYVYVCI